MSGSAVADGPPRMRPTTMGSTTRPHEVLGVAKHATRPRSEATPLGAQASPRQEPRRPRRREAVDPWKVYGVLGDADKRKVYDETGRVDDAELFGDKFDSLPGLPRRLQESHRGGRGRLPRLVPRRRRGTSRRRPGVRQVQPPHGQGVHVGDVTPTSRWTRTGSRTSSKPPSPIESRRSSTRIGRGRRLFGRSPRPRIRSRSGRGGSSPVGSGRAAGVRAATATATATAGT